jgi:hypothetical protein
VDFNTQVSLVDLCVYSVGATFEALARPYGQVELAEHQMAQRARVRGLPALVTSTSGNTWKEFLN